MVSTSLDLERFFRRPDAVAAVAPAAELFSLLRRSVDLPHGWSALATRKTGDRIICRPGTAVVDQELTEVLFARVAPLDLHLDERGLTSADQHDCWSVLHLRLLTIPEKSELACLRDSVLGSSRILLVAGLVRYLQPYVRDALDAHARARAAADLIERPDRQAIERAVRAALEPVLFSAGLAVAELVSVDFDSTSFRAAQQAEQASARQHRAHESERQLQEARAAAQRQHLDHLAGFLARLDELARRSPSVGLVDLVRTFSDSERGELYHALFGGAAPVHRTRWLVVAAGNELLYFDPTGAESPVRRVGLDLDAGGLRSVQLAATPDDAAPRLWIGAATGVYELPLDAAEPVATYIAPHLGLVRGGFNAVATVGNLVLASHSELGLWAWPRTAVAAPQSLLEPHTRAARSVRDVQVHDHRVYVSIDDRVLILPEDALDKAEPAVLSGSGATITALHAAPPGVFAGNSDGVVLCWPRSADGLAPAPRILHGPTRRAVESVAVLDAAGVPRLFFTDDSPAVHARVIDDSFTCQYQAGGQILRRAAVAPDCLVATTESRDRLICWKPSDPDRPAAIIPVARLTGHTIQDVCLVPFPSDAAAPARAGSPVSLGATKENTPGPETCPQT